MIAFDVYILYYELSNDFLMNMYYKQNPESRKNLQFHVLEVEEDVQMAKFVEEKLGVKFENRRAFYEFTHGMEDLLFYRDVVAMPKVIKDQYTMHSFVHMTFYL